MIVQESTTILEFKMIQDTTMIQELTYQKIKRNKTIKSNLNNCKKNNKRYIFSLFLDYDAKKINLAIRLII
jgi:hypothetical protein